MGTNDLSDRQWEGLRPLLPLKPRTGRPAHDHRTILNGILWILRTGSPWRCLPERYGSWKTVSSRFYRWQKAGVWNRILSLAQQIVDAEGRLDWSLHFVDSTVVRAHQHAAGAKGGDPQAEALGRSRGGHSTKIHLRCERGGKPMALVLTEGQRHEQLVLSLLMERGAVKRAGRGRPRVGPTEWLQTRGTAAPRFGAN
jgi:transposase